MRKWLLPMMMALAVLLIAGCGATPAVRPVTAVAMVLADPAVGAWYRAHSAPGVLTGLDAAEVKRSRRYRPAAAVDLVKEGLQVKLESRFGPGPHQVEVLLDRPTGQVLRVVWKQ
jgi:hypothetical protein